MDAHTRYLDPRYRLVAFADDLVFLVADRRSVVLEGKLVCAVARNLGSPVTVAGLADRLEGRFDVLEVLYGLDILERQGCLVSDTDIADSATAAPSLDELPWGAWAAPARDAVHDSALRLESVEIALPPAFAASASRRGSDGGASLTLLVTDDYSREEVRGALRSHRTSGRPVLLAKVGGRELWIGPVLSGTGRPCWTCLSVRLERCLRVHAFVQRAVERGDARRVEHGRRTPSPGSLELALSAARSWLRDPDGHPVEGHIWTRSPGAGGWELHRLVPVPGCPTCSGDRSRPRLSGMPSFQPWIGPRAGDDEARGSGPPAAAPETLRTALDELEKRVDPLVGMVSRSHDAGPAGSPLRLWATTNPAARDHDDWGRMRESLRSRCVGKGLHADEARLGALAEAMERYSGIAQGDEPVVRGSFGGLGEVAVHPDQCLNFSELQYAERDAWNRREAHSNWVPEPFDETAELRWSPLWSLTHARTRYLPTEYLYYTVGGYGRADQDRASRASPRSRFLRPDSNGCAAGASLGDAVIRGLMELVERDCVAIWWYNRLRRPAVELDAVREGDLPGIIRACRAMAGSVVVFDITNDLGVPAFAAVAHGEEGRPEDIGLGFGAHLDAATAVRRALLELGQTLVSRSAGAEGIPAFQAEALDPAFLQPGTERAPITAGTALLPRTLPAEGPEALAWCLDRFQAKGLEVLVVDQTREDAGVPVARVVVPGLRPHWARFREGRLYDVPVRMGCLEDPRSERELNPAHLLL